MPMHVGEMTSEVTVVDEDLPLTQAQTERLVRLVLRRLREVEREQGQIREATGVRREARPPFALGE